MWATNIFIFFSLLSLASASSRARHQPSVITSCNRPGVIALTFDDGPYQYGPALLEELSAAGAKATFFVSGTAWDCIYHHADYLRSALAAGHQIASHTWSHADLAYLGPDGIESEMSRLDEAFADILGIKPRYMRPPYGSIGGETLSTLWNLGYEIVTWDVDTGDWRTDVGTSQSAVAQAGTGGNGHIVLMHETLASTVDQLVPWILDYARQHGLEFVTVADCVGDPDGAHSPAEPGYGTGTC
ncbi:hypothetical protein VTO42DRAFT_3989 [Malbranchea cinnamomea]